MRERKKRAKKQKINNFPIFLGVRLSENQLAKLDKLVESGIHGKSQSEVIRTLLEQAI